MLRPATPLSIILLLAFVLLLLSTLSTPIIPSIPLGSYQGVNLGVFGYCQDGSCTGPMVGYSTAGLVNGTNTNNAFDLPSETRHSLSSILVVHPVAALLTLICFGLAVAAHFHGPSHSPRYLLALLILTFPTLLVALLAFLVDILLFVPHVGWGGWIVLAATILIVASSIVTCAMRRTLVSRKARKKRIEENADMNGSEYYNNLAAQRVDLPPADTFPRADSPPPMSGSTVADKNGPQFAAYEMKRQDTHDGRVGGPGSMDDRTPLNPNGNPSIRSGSTGGRKAYHDENAPPMPMDRQPSLDGAGIPRRPSRDQFGNPIPAGSAIGMAASQGLRHENSQGSLRGPPPPNGYGNGYPPSRGRGYGPPPRGYGPPRGGFGPRGRGGYGGPPPPGWRGRGGYGPLPRGGMMGRGGPPPRQGQPPGYDPYYGPPRMGPPAQMNQPPPPPHGHFDGPIGQAIEMDERTGSAQGRQISPNGQNGPYGLRDSDADVAGMIGLQQGHHQSPPAGPSRQNSNQASEPRSPTSMYSEQQYVPPRQQWSGAPSPLHNEYDERHVSDDNHSGNPAVLHASIAAASSTVLPQSPAQASPHAISPVHPSPPQHHRTESEPYYEDVDPRFAQEDMPPPEPYHALGNTPNRDSGLPATLTPGAFSGNSHTPSPGPADPSYSSSSFLERRPHPPHLHGMDMLEPIPDGTRSPGEGSEASHFTSVSQRPVNPDWRPSGGMPPGGTSAYGGTTASARVRRQEDVLLNTNPDFSIPGVGLPGKGIGRGRGRSAAGIPAASAMPSSRYPTDI